MVCWVSLRRCLVVLSLLVLVTGCGGGGGGATNVNQTPDPVPSTRVNIIFSDDDELAYIDLVTDSGWVKYTGGQEIPGFISMGTIDHWRLLPVPATVGQSWSDQDSCTVASASETVVVPAGTFTNCVRVDGQTQEGAQFSRWFAEGVGLVRFKAYPTPSPYSGYEVVLGEVTLSAGSAGSWWPLKPGNTWTYLLVGDPTGRTCVLAVGSK